MTNTLYWAGGEDVSFSSISAITGTSVGGVSYRSSFARGVVYFGGSPFGPNTSFPLSHYARTPQFGPVSSFWVHGYFSGGSTNISNNGIWVVLYDSSGDPRIVIRGGSGGGQIKISTVNTAGTFTDIATSATGVINYTEPNPNPCPLDIYVNYSTAGQVTCYWNGVNVCDTGPGVNVTTNSVTALAQVDYSCCFGDFTNFGWSECVVQSSSTLGVGLVTLPPVAAGNTQTWTGSVSNVNELVLNESNYNYTTSASQLSEWTVSTSLPTGTWTILGVTQAAALSAGASAPQHFAFDVRTSAGSSYQGSEIALTNGFAFYQYVWNTNPNTGSAWNAGELINSGVESYS